MRNKVLKANGLCRSDTIDVSVRRQFEGKIFGLHKPKQWDSKSWQLERVVSSFLCVTRKKDTYEELKVKY